MSHLMAEIGRLLNKTMQLIQDLGRQVNTSGDLYPRSHPSLVLKPGIVCTFLIHSGSLQKMLTALFNLVRNTQKSVWTIFFECQGKVFLSIEKILEKISQDQP